MKESRQRAEVRKMRKGHKKNQGNKPVKQQKGKENTFVDFLY
jgi:hypothetical protein